MRLQVASKPDSLETKLLKQNKKLTIVKHRILIYVINVNVGIGTINILLHNHLQSDNDLEHH